ELQPRARITLRRLPSGLVVDHLPPAFGGAEDRVDPAVHHEALEIQEKWAFGVQRNSIGEPASLEGALEPLHLAGLPGQFLEGEIGSFVQIDQGRLAAALALDPRVDPRPDPGGRAAEPRERPYRGPV